MSDQALQISEAQESDAFAWNAFVEAHEHGSTFHRWEWRDVYAGVYGHACPYLIARRGGAIVGVLPLVRVKSLVFGHYLVSLPYVSYGGPLSDAEGEAALTDAAANLAHGAKLVELRSRIAISTTLTPVNRKITVLLDLVPGDYDATFKRFDSKLRSQVRRGEKEGIVVKFGREHAAAYHQVFVEHMRDLGSPAHGLRFFERLADSLGDRAWIGVAYLGDTPVAAGFAIENGREVEISWASALRRYQKISPNMALYGAFIRRACERGFDVFNFGRCTEGSGTHKFKKQWGSQDEPLQWYFGAATGLLDIPTSESPGYRSAVRVWQALPLAIARVLGSHLIAGIP
ncbi:MAG: FemAB family PEP-CTERM system-associated protein [Gemmatimonadaceae bacterium]|nr:FemAB family PEP-CTERM system-associated protein [Gemmatimonadaceae bacterium]